MIDKTALILDAIADGITNDTIVLTDESCRALSRINAAITQQRIRQWRETLKQNHPELKK